MAVVKTFLEVMLAQQRMKGIVKSLFATLKVVRSKHQYNNSLKKTCTDKNGCCVPWLAFLISHVS